MGRRFGVSYEDRLEAESEGSCRQNPVPTNRNRIEGIYGADEFATQNEVQHYPNTRV